MASLYLTTFTRPFFSLLLILQDLRCNYFKDLMRPFGKAFGIILHILHKQTFRQNGESPKESSMGNKRLRKHDLERKAIEMRPI